MYCKMFYLKFGVYIKYYITTPIFYVTNKPHIGTAYTVIIADILARWHRLAGDDVFFLTGTDEHGEKIDEAAKKSKKTPQELVDEVSENYKDSWKALGITNNDFIRTTDKKHVETVGKFLTEIYKKGDIYKGTYEGWYCVPDETFITELQLIDGKCPICGREVKKVKEESYFFKLSKYQDKLLELYNKNTKFLMPKNKSQEIINRVKSGLNDISISRSTVKWGVELPMEKDHTVYVWFDALVNYLSAINWPNEEYKKYWPADLHLVGKEINWFHSVIWPAMLFSIGLDVPKTIFAHGWLTVEGKKMSKSLGNVVDPLDIIKKYGNDSLRYFYVREIPLGDDADFSEKALISRINGELVNDLGNLVYRTLTLVEKFSGDIKGNKELEEKINIQKINNYMNDFDTFNAIEEIWSIVRNTNKYINEKEAWKLSGEELGSVLYNLLESLRIISILLLPFMPETSEKIRKQLGTPVEKLSDCIFKEYSGKIKKEGHLFEKIK